MFSEDQTKGYVRVCVADDDDTGLVSVTPSNPADTVGVIPIVHDRTARNVLADFQQLPESGSCPSIIALFVGVHVPKEHTSDWTCQPRSKNDELEERGGLTDILCRVGGSTRRPGA